MSLRFGDILQPTDPLIVTYTLFREALLATSAIWQPLWAYVSAFMMDYWKGPIVSGARSFVTTPSYYMDRLSIARGHARLRR
jgi:hypothetical protein